MSALSVPHVQQLLSISPVVTINMAYKRATSKEITESSTGEAVEQISIDLPVYADTKLFIDKGMPMT